MVNSYIGIPKYLVNAILIITIVYWSKTGLVYYFLKENKDVKLHIWKNYWISMRSNVIPKAFDATLWFIVQLIEQIRYPNHLKLQKVKLIWK